MDPFAALSPRRFAVLTLHVFGQGCRETAARLGIAERKQALRTPFGHKDVRAVSPFVAKRLGFA